MKVRDLSEEQLAMLIRDAVESALADLLVPDDPDSGLDLRPSIRERLLASASRLQAGETGRSLDDVARNAFGTP